MDFATDLDHIVGLGYSRRAAQAALQVTKGDRNAALLVLRKDGIERTDGVWREEQSGDWRHGVSSNLPTMAQNRGLWKTPIYARISSYRREDEEVFYVIHVVLKDGKKWVVERTFLQFLEFKTALPITACAHLTHWFPRVSLFGLTLKLEVRCKQLEDWMMELFLDETAMKNKAVLSCAYSFLDAERFVGLKEKETSQDSLVSSIVNVFLPPSPPSNSVTAKLEAEDVEQQLQFTPGSPVSLPPLPRVMASSSAPLSLAALPAALPFTLNVNDFPELVTLAEFSTTADASDKQLEKDFSRDRVVLQGVRQEGHSHGVTAIVRSAVTVVSGLLSRRSVSAESSELDAVCRSLLRRLGRTESAFLSFSALQRLLILSDDDMIVPESSLAGPIIINFKILDKPSSSSSSSSSLSSPAPAGRLGWCVAVEGFADTVYRVMDGDRTKLQLRVSYRRNAYVMLRCTGPAPISVSASLRDSSPLSSQPSTTTRSPDRFLIPASQPPFPSTVAVGIPLPDDHCDDSQQEQMQGQGLEQGSAVVPAATDDEVGGEWMPGLQRVNLTIKEGSTFIVFQQETKTTDRDWK